MKDIDITSRQNATVKFVRSLQDKKSRKEFGLYLAEGVNLLKDADILPETVLATPSRYEEAKKFFASSKILTVTDEVMQSVSDTKSPYGILAVVKMPKNEFKYPDGNAVLLDGVEDAGNLGTIMRTAIACGFDTVYLLDTADVYSPKVVRASLGAIFGLNVIEIDETQAIDLVRHENSAVLDMGGKNLLGERLTDKILFVAGSEAHGVRDSLKKNCKEVYSLPMKHIESLNVAVATAVAMYQTLRS